MTNVHVNWPKLRPSYIGLQEVLLCTLKSLAGGGNEAQKLNASDSVKQFAQQAATVLAHVADAAYLVAQSFNYLGNNIGATLAQIAAFGSGDFKGGAAFADLEALPHTAGMITNLQDDHGLNDRMHDALFGEQERRQRMLRHAGNGDGVTA